MLHSCLHGCMEAVEGLELGSPFSGSRSLAVSGLWPRSEAGVERVGEGRADGGGKAVPSCVPAEERETEAEMSLARSRNTEH